MQRASLGLCYTWYDNYIVTQAVRLCKYIFLAKECDKMIEVFTPYIHVGGKVIWASQRGLKAFHFYVTQEEHEAYLARKRSKKSK